jgi:c-di-GMP-related signal transduction protein
MSSVLESIPLDHETKALLLGAPSKLRPLYDLMLARESGDWKTTADSSKKLGLSESEVAAAFWQAMQWTRQVSSQS